MVSSSGAISSRSKRERDANPQFAEPPAKRPQVSFAEDTTSRLIDAAPVIHDVNDFADFVRRTGEAISQSDREPLVVKIRELQLELKQCPFPLRRRKLEDEIRDAQSQIDKIDQGHLTDRAKQMTTKFDARLARAIQQRSHRVFEKRIATSGGAKRLQNLQERLRNEDDLDNTVLLVTDRCRSESGAAPPPLYVVPSHECPSCKRPLTFLMDTYTYSCPRCKGAAIDASAEFAASNVTFRLKANRMSSVSKDKTDIGAAHTGQSIQVNSGQHTQLQDLLASIQCKKKERIPPALFRTVGWFLAKSMWETGDDATQAFIDAVTDEVSARGPFLTVENAFERMPESFHPFLDRAFCSLETNNIVCIIRQLETDGNRYYRQAPAIAQYLRGMKPPSIDWEIEHEVLEMCYQLIPVACRFSQKDGNYWGGYPYSIFCHLLLLGYDEFLPMLSLQDCTKHDKVRFEACKVLNWQWVPATAPFPEIEYEGTPRHEFAWNSATAALWQSSHDDEEQSTELHGADFEAVMSDDDDASQVSVQGAA